MAAVLIEAPASEPLSLAEAKNYLRIVHDTDDALIGSMIAAARIQVESRTPRADNADLAHRARSLAVFSTIVSPVSPLREVVAARVRDEQGDA